MTCKHCGRKISRWDEASLQLGREIFTHDDLVDVDNDGVRCNSETDEVAVKSA